MLKEGPANEVSIYVGEDRQFQEQSLYSAILNLLFCPGISGASFLGGVAGLGADRQLHTTPIEILTADLSVLSSFADRPMMLSIADTEEKPQRYLPILDEMVQQVLEALSDVDVIKYKHDFMNAERRQETRI